MNKQALKLRYVLILILGYYIFKITLLQRGNKEKYQNPGQRGYGDYKLYRITECSTLKIEHKVC